MHHYTLCSPLNAAVFSRVIQAANMRIPDFQAIADHCLLELDPNNIRRRLFESLITCIKHELSMCRTAKLRLVLVSLGEPVWKIDAKWTTKWISPQEFLWSRLEAVVKQKVHVHPLQSFLTMSLCVASESAQSFLTSPVVLDNVLVCTRLSSRLTQSDIRNDD